MYHRNPPSLWQRTFSGAFAFFVRFKVQGLFFSKHFSFSLGSFKSALEVFRRSVLHDYKPLEGYFWIYSMPSYHSSCELRSLKLSPLGQQCHLIIRVVDSDPSKCRPWASSTVLSFELWTPIPRILSFRPASPLAHSSSGFRSHGSPFYNIPLCYEVCRTFGLLFEGVSHNLPSLCI
jgi:hypothetical protein